MVVNIALSNTITCFFVLNFLWFPSTQPMHFKKISTVSLNSWVRVVYKDQTRCIMVLNHLVGVHLTSYASRVEFTYLIILLSSIYLSTKCFNSFEMLPSCIVPMVVVTVSSHVCKWLPMSLIAKYIYLAFLPISALDILHVSSLSSSSLQIKSTGIVIIC